jgi:hypothetical protein
MTKQILIEGCGACLYSYRAVRELYCSLKTKPVDIDTIQDDCPLPDAPKQDHYFTFKKLKDYGLENAIRQWPVQKQKDLGVYHLLSPKPTPTFNDAIDAMMGYK